MIARIWHGWAPRATADDYQRHFEQAVVEEAARRVLSRWDERVSHHEVAVDVP